MEKQKQRPCITKDCDCKTGKRKRGLCDNCYSKLKYLVDQKKTTWKELEQLGFAAAPIRKPAGMLLERLEAAKAKAKAAKKKTKGGK